MFKRKHAFTLVELLVVISIIALLLSILMPSLNKARKIAKSVVCMSQLKQWSVIFTMYGNDNNTSFPNGGYTKGGAWPVALRPYYGNPKSGNNGPSIWRCPETVKATLEGGKNPFSCWLRTARDADPSVDTMDAWPDGIDTYASYGMNQWCSTIPESALPTSGYDWAHRNLGHQCWRSSSKCTRPDNIPLFMGCFQPWGYPRETDAPPEYDGALNYGPGGMNPNMCYFVLNRHSGRAPVLFVDGTVRYVSLKLMYTLYWHKDWDMTLIPLETELPAWLRQLPSGK